MFPSACRVFPITPFTMQVNCHFFSEALLLTPQAKSALIFILICHQSTLFIYRWSILIQTIKYEMLQNLKLFECGLQIFELEMIKWKSLCKYSKIQKNPKPERSILDICTSAYTSIRAPYI
jgi:hypothetical protein